MSGRAGVPRHPNCASRQPLRAIVGERDGGTLDVLECGHSVVASRGNASMRRVSRRCPACPPVEDAQKRRQA